MRAKAARIFLLLLLGVAGPAAGPAVLLPFAPPATPPRYMPSRQYDLQHLRLDLAFDWETRSVSGTATNTLVPLRPGLESVVFHAVGLEVRSISVAGTERPFTVDSQAGTLVVPLGGSFGPGDRLEVAVDLPLPAAFA